MRSLHIHADRGLAVISGIFDPIVSVVESAADVATSVIDRLPASEFLKDTAGTLTDKMKDFVDGPMRDFARTTVGESIMRAVSIGIFYAAYTMNPALGPYVFPWLAPTLALASMSIPGLAKGEPFDEAVAKEAAYRLAYLVNFFSKEAGDAVAKAVGPLFSDQFGKAIAEGKRQLDRSFPGVSTPEALRRLGIQPQQVLEGMGLTPKQLAARLNIREDMAALAIAWLRRDSSYFSEIREWYDPKTGADTKAAFYAAIKAKLDAQNAAEISALVQLSEADPCQAYVKAMATGGRRNDIAPVLKIRCEEHKQQDLLLTALLRRSPCEAYVESVRLGRLDQPLFKARCAESKASSPSNATPPIAATMGPDSEAKSFPFTSLALAIGAVAVIGGAAWLTMHKGS